MSITFSSSENNYWCFFFIIIATRRKRRTQRDSETRERNEEKRTFCDRKTDELRTHRRFYHPRPFRRRLRNDLRYLFHILLHHRSTSRSRRRTHSARACAFFSFFSYLRYKNEKRDRRAQKGKLLSSATVPTTPSERPQICTIFLHHRSTSRSRRRTHSARARASSSFPLSFLLARFLRTKNKRRKKRQSALELRYTVFSSAIVRNDLRFLFQCFIIIARRLEKKPKKKKNRESSSSSSSSSKARTFSFLYLYLGALYLSLSKKSARIFYAMIFFETLSKKEGKKKTNKQKKKEKKSTCDTLNVPHTQRGEKIGLLSGPHNKTEKKKAHNKTTTAQGRRRRRRRRNTHLFFLSLSSQSLFFGRRSKDPRGRHDEARGPPEGWCGPFVVGFAKRSQRRSWKG